MDNLPLFSPVKMHVGSASFTVQATWQQNLDPADDQFAAAVMYVRGTNVPRGLHVCVEGVWRFVAPFEEVMLSLYYGGSVEVYYKTDDTVVFSSAAIGVFRNGVRSPDTQTVPNINAVWSVVLPPATGPEGTVSSVNNIAPDASGNVQLPQFANYSISLPAQPDAGATVYYQEFVDSLQYLSGQASVKEAPTGEDITFNILHNNSVVGSIDFPVGSNSGTITLGSLSVGSGDILEIVAPSDLREAAVFSIVLTFERV